MQNEINCNGSDHDGSIKRSDVMEAKQLPRINSVPKQKKSESDLSTSRWFPTPNGFVMAMRSVHAELLAGRSHGAGILLWMIALRAWRGPGMNAYGCDVAEAFVGDWERLGFTHQGYRTAKKQLEELGFASFRTSNKGTIAKLQRFDVYDINVINDLEQGAEQQTSNKQATNKQQTSNKQATTEQQTSNKQATSNNKLTNKELKELKELKEVNNTKPVVADAPPNADFSSPSESGEAEGEGEVEVTAERETPDTTGDVVELTPDQKAVMLSKELPVYVKFAAGLPRIPVFTAIALEEARSYFQRNIDYAWWDVLAICLLGIKCAREHAIPAEGVDPYYQCRRYAHLPNKMFERNKDDDLHLALMQLELRYNPDSDHDVAWFEKLIKDEMDLAVSRERRSVKNGHTSS